MACSNSNFRLVPESRLNSGSQIARLRDSGANIFFYWGTPKAAAQSIRKVAEIGWKPTFFLSSTSSSIGSVLKPAGLENAKGIISAAYYKDPSDPELKQDPDVQQWDAFMDKYLPQANKTDTNAVFGYAAAATLVEVLRGCGDDLTRANVMKQAASLKAVRIAMLLDGLTINTGPDDFFPIEQIQLMRFDGQAWHLSGELINGEVGSAKRD